LPFCRKIFLPDEVNNSNYCNSFSKSRLEFLSWYTFRFSMILIELFNLLQDTEFSRLRPGPAAIQWLKLILTTEVSFLMVKTVSATSKSIQVENGAPEGLPFQLSSNAESVYINIYNSTGNHETTIEAGTLGAGYHNLSWDGKNDQGNPVADGEYSCEITALNANGGMVETTTLVKGKIDRIDYQNDTVCFVVKNQKIPVENVVRITSR
jgi:hypothetical protein